MFDRPGMLEQHGGRASRHAVVDADPKILRGIIVSEGLGQAACCSDPSLYRIPQNGSGRRNSISDGRDFWPEVGSKSIAKYICVPQFLVVLSEMKVAQL